MFTEYALRVARLSLLKEQTTLGLDIRLVRGLTLGKMQ
jgi:hypothetical protein